MVKSSLGYSLAILMATLPIANSVRADEKKYDTGASDTEIKLGETIPYSGPLSITGTIGRLHQAYFKWINDNGGINGRKVTLISLDDQYNPSKSIELARQLVESDGVLLMFGSLGTQTNAVQEKYLNAKKIPQLFIMSGGTRFFDPKESPWTIGFLPTSWGEAKQDARYVLSAVKDPKIAILAQSGDMAKDYIGGFREGLGDAADKLIVKQMTYEATDPSLDSQTVSLAATGANVLLLAATQKAGAQVIRKMNDLGWKPKTLLVATDAGWPTVLQPVGFDKVQGDVASLYWKQPGDPTWKDDPGMKEYLDWHAKFYPEGVASDNSDFAAYMSAQTMAYVLKQAGDNLTRENIMKIATHLDHVPLGMLLPGVTLTTSPDNYRLMRARQTMEFKGEQWVPIGPVQTEE